MSRVNYITLSDGKTCPDCKEKIKAGETAVKVMSESKYRQFISYLHPRCWAKRSRR